MKKIILILLMFVASVTYAQTCFNSTTNPGSIVCANSNLLWTTTSLGAKAGDAIVWTMVDGTGGATFAATGLNTPYATVVNAGTPNVNSVLVHMGPNAGTVTVVMSYPNNPNTNSCSSSGIVKTLSVVGTPSVLLCPNALGSITAVGTTHFPDPPGDLNLDYTYTLVETGAFNNTGFFPGLAAGTYHVTINDGECTSAASAGITILPVAPNPIIVNCPALKEMNSCAFADQAAVQVAFDDWLDDFTKSGGFEPVITNTIPGAPIAAPLLCGGEITVRWVVTDRCEQRQECTGTFRINAPPVVNPLLPADRDVRACDIVDRAYLLGVIAAYKAEFGKNGGCAPQLAFDDVIVPENICSGEIAIRGRISDRCIADIPFVRFIHILAAPALVTNAPLPVVINYCDAVTAEQVAQRFTDFLAGFTKAGGCNPQLTIEPHGNPNVCGGLPITVTARVSDRCAADVILQSTFEVKQGAAPIVDRGGDVNLGSCLTQAEIDASFATFLGSVTAHNECGVLNVTTDAAVRPDRCLGGNVPVTFRINARCFDEIVIIKHFIVAAAPTPTLLCAADKRIACDAAFVFDAPTPGGNCGPLNVNVIGTVVSVDGQSSTRTWDVTNDCGVHSAQCSQTITKEPCDFNGCTLGYWKTHTKAWNCYSTCTLYKDVFTGSTLNANLTLLEALNLGGGDCNNLARQSVAALLNICEGLPFHITTTADLQAQVNAAFADGKCGALGAKLDGFNNEGGANHCNVEKSPNTSAPSASCAAPKTAKMIDAPKTAGITRFIAFPNPFRAHFNLDVHSNSDAPMDVNVYDMLGKRIDCKSFMIGEGKNMQLGQDYPAGMYNVILKQDTEVKTLRIIKE